jgi:hypothetical protein
MVVNVMVVSGCAAAQRSAQTAAIKQLVEKK